ncbi:MAG: hypothetical protein COU90_04210 [Candidatus Ryanbacteria bacterium CG10_big_fil_rev_8_21_14_0_10_43_42]|uniref:Uncharacterized protein n=1 Tax=Candidatus Ryanbacteria bacterium CG10_big_fil_rev_8_21_14_0_10_43_42 TaxID=1974864 RepID=A0A2M8KVV0_9BACT|nr:MAG: hypothetical protein COU90_04210 [Candidatus Ryanbacteria bacterium CG10_big_fil_rev_8_21_14_0_10_43_42]
MISDIIAADEKTRGTNLITNEQVIIFAKRVRILTLEEECRNLGVEILESALLATKHIAVKQDRAVVMMKELSLEEPETEWLEAFMFQFDDDVRIMAGQTTRVMLDNERHAFLRHLPDLAKAFGGIGWKVLCYALIDSDMFADIKKQALFIKQNMPAIYLKYNS